MHYHRLVCRGGGEERPPDPDQILIVLLIERQPWPNAGMGEEITAEAKAWPRLPQDGKLLGRDQGRPILRAAALGNAPIGEASVTALAPPMARRIAAFHHRLKTERLMIAEQIDEAPRNRRAGGYPRQHGGI